MRSIWRANRLVFSVLLASTAAVAVLASAPAAQADSSTTLTVLGTSDVSDSFLVQSIIKPGFEQAHPGVTLNYVSSGTGQAITAAEAGQGDALIVHAASLENQFVNQGYSLGGPGRAVFYGDFVLAGPAADPAGVLANGSHDIVTAFEDIAAAGAAGKATFVSRGGTPGTTIAEHQLWALADPAKVQTCAVSPANGGGTTPSTTTGDCPATVTPPSWYSVTGAKQGANVQTADTCPSATFPNGGCYVFTDRGTFQYLQQQSLLKNLQVVTRDNSASARGGDTALVNSFHAYAIDPAKFASNPNVHLNPTLATEFLDYLTSPAAQSAVGAYLANNAYGAPFLPDAAPLVTASSPAAAVTGGKPITITGSVRNMVPGTPALGGKPVSLKVTPTSQPQYPYIGATTTTDKDGNYTLSYVPVGAATYSVTTGSITQVERPDLTPTFSDVLAPSSSGSSAQVAVQGTLAVTRLTPYQRQITGTVTLAPKVAFRTGTLQLYRAPFSTKGPGKMSYVSSYDITRGHTAAYFQYYLPSGKQFVQLRYVDDGVVLPVSGPVQTVTVR